MKTKGLSTFASLRAGVVALVATALVITPLAVCNRKWSNYKCRSN